MRRKAEELRIKYLYRNLVLRGKMRLPFEAALKIVGPDCAYHLYSFQEFSNKDKTALKTDKIFYIRQDQL